MNKPSRPIPPPSGMPHIGPRGEIKHKAPAIDDVSYWSTQVMTNVKDWKKLRQIASFLINRADELSLKEIEDYEDLSIEGNES